MRKKAKSKLETVTGYMVEMLIGEYWLVAWQNNNGKPLVFKSHEGAMQRVAEHLMEWKQAVIDGFVEEAPRASQFRVVEVQYPQTVSLKRKRRKR